MLEQRKRGRPAQNKSVRPYSIDQAIADFVDRLPDGERSRFVNSILRQGIELEQLSGRYYTYLLVRPDGSVFYVGKGTGNRINNHEAEARKGVVSHKCNVIRKIWEDGGEVIKLKVGFFDAEEDAHHFEILLIKFFGRENLTNQTDGGESGSDGRPVERSGEYQRKTIEIRSDLIDFLNSLRGSWRASVEEALIDLRNKKARQTMVWHNDTQSYRGETADGKVVDVTGDEYAEALADGVKAEAEQRGLDPDNLTDEQREICEKATYAEIDDPEVWANLVGDNQNVEFVER